MCHHLLISNHKRFVGQESIRVFISCKIIFCLEKSSEVSHVEELGNYMKRECMWILSCRLLGIIVHNIEESAKLQKEKGVGVVSGCYLLVTSN